MKQKHLTETIKMANKIRYAVLCALVVYPCISQAHDINKLDTTNIKPTKIIKLKKIEKRYKKLIVGEKNIASSMSVIGEKQIKRSSSSASIYSLLKQSPSVNEYQQNIGPSMPVLTIRGVRMSQLAQTLDGIPITSLLSGGNGALNSYSIGSIVSTGQISGIHIYPGVAPPDRTGFATIGGTVNYQSKQPTSKKYADIFSKVGSFSTDVFGLQVNSGNIPHTGGLKFLARYSNTQTAGYIQHTPQRFSDFLFSVIKPYDYGLSKIFATVIYNKGNGYEQDQGGYPVPLENKYGLFFNQPLWQTSTYQNNKYLTAILGDTSYINRYVVMSGRVFYIHKNGKFESYVNPDIIGFNYPYQNSYYVPINSDAELGGPNAPNNDFTYNPVKAFGSYNAGEDSGVNIMNSSTIGFAPKINLFLPHNNITIGALISDEVGHVSQYVYGSLNMPQINGYNAFEYGIRQHRVVYSGYVQDKINLLSNKLHIEPGVTLTSASSSNYVPQNVYATPDHPYTLSNQDKVALPYLGISYDFTKHIIGYASYGKGARFAPIEDYTLGINGSTTKAPGPETVNAYEAGIRYVSKRLYLNFDGYLQNEHGLFSFYTDPTIDYSSYKNVGSIQAKGLELSGKYYLTRNLLLSGNASYTQANYNNFYFAEPTPSGSLFGYVSAGDPLPDVPNWLANLSLDYHKGNFNGNITGSYTGTMVATNYGYLPPAEQDPAIYTSFPFWPHPDSAMRFGNYFILNMAASYKIPVHMAHLKWLKVSLNIDNILDRHYYVHLGRMDKTHDYINAPDPVMYDAAYPGMPRFIELGLEGRFT
ncbi:TonB-dependent receptor [Acidithiobacillus thiooxidans]|uniref:TonB-dependent receptor n=1 Tax=Acidithiobacillus thiooxidans TaxID=930 RepID=UPI001C075C7F|nr:TonB-dependent receptor [Acidithiobacillus thiooxidans]MBU2750753.1 TonB-dependent receptor [Acidithiobacillus thiooxidans]